MGEVKYWGIESIDDNTRLQAEKMARSPIVSGHLALMPDGHVGAGATIGSVFVSDSGINPSAVGVDIGCGMAAVKTDLTANDLPDSLQQLHSEFERSIPAGVGPGKREVKDEVLKWFRDHPHEIDDSQLLRRAQLQLGTLGSGNHFVEVCLDEDDSVWVVLHSGSRGVGNRLADNHIKRAKQFCRDMGLALEDPDLGYFLIGTPEFEAYVGDMLWSQAYALENREMMVDEALNQLFRFVKKGRQMERVNCHHNYAVQEVHDGKEVWITRKGAVRAEVGDLIVIPGSMGTRSYIATGLGNADSYNSCSHGAGRAMSRGQARRELSIDDFERQMAGKTWNSGDATSLIDESPGAYKDIDEIMQAQKDLVEVKYVLHQVLNYKGVDTHRGRRRKK